MEVNIISLPVYIVQYVLELYFVSTVLDCIAYDRNSAVSYESCASVIEENWQTSLDGRQCLTANGLQTPAGVYGTV